MESLGHCHADCGGLEVLKTSWLLTQDAPSCDEHWMSNRSHTFFPSLLLLLRMTGLQSGPGHLHARPAGGRSDAQVRLPSPFPFAQLSWGCILLQALLTLSLGHDSQL